MLVVGNLLYLLAVPGVMAFSRHLEHEADRFGLEITQDNLSAGMSFVKLLDANLGNPRPGWLYKIWHSSHPTPAERIELCNEYRPWERGERLHYGDRFRTVKEAASANTKEDMSEALWAAVRNGDMKAITTLLDQGADVNAKNKIGVTALWIAAGKGKLDVAELLVGRGADVNARDAIWYQTPLSSAVGAGNAEVVKFLIRSGAKDIDEVVLIAVAGRKMAVVQALLDRRKPN